MTTSSPGRAAPPRRTRTAANRFSTRVFELTRQPLKAWVVLAISLAITWVAWSVSGNFVRARQADRFQFTTEDIKAAITKRLQDQEEVLRGGVGLYAASDYVSRDEWRRYVDSLAIDKYYPACRASGSLRASATKISPAISIQRARKAFRTMACGLGAIAPPMLLSITWSRSIGVTSAPSATTCTPSRPGGSR